MSFHIERGLREIYENIILPCLRVNINSLLNEENNTELSKFFIRTQQ